MRSMLSVVSEPKSKAPPGSLTGTPSMSTLDIVGFAATQMNPW